MREDEIYVEDDIYREGYTAYTEGRFLGENPYMWGEDAYNWWQQGWSDAEFLYAQEDEMFLDLSDPWYGLRG